MSIDIEVNVNNQKSGLHCDTLKDASMLINDLLTKIINA